MEEISKKILIASGIVEIKKSIIPVEELVNYINTTSHNLKTHNYNVEKTTKEDLLIFFNRFPGFGKYNGKEIIIDKLDNTLEKISGFILKDLSEDLKKVLRLEIKYNLPINFNDDIIVYSFFSNDAIQDKLKNILYYDLLNDAYLISFNDVSYDEVLNYIIKSSSKIKKSSIQIDRVLEFKAKIDSLVDTKYDNIRYAFKMDMDVDKLIKYSKYIKDYYGIAEENTAYLEENDKIKPLLSILKQKIK